MRLVFRVCKFTFFLMYIFTLPLLFVLNVNESFFRMFTTVLISGVCTVLSILFLGMTKNERNAVLAKPKSVMLNLFQHPKKSHGKEDCLYSVQ